MWQLEVHGFVPLDSLCRELPLWQLEVHTFAPIPTR
jgi:hypothetical protein